MYEAPVGSQLDVLFSWLGGSLFLYISLFTLTIPHPSLVYLRLALALPAILCYWNFGYGSHQPPTQTVSAGFATIGLYGIMRVLEHSIISLWDPIPPYRILRMKNGKESDQVACPSPKSFPERCYYALDLLTSLRGSSWSSDLEWNWIPRRFRLISPSRSQFLLDGVKTLVIQFLLIDMVDTINKSRTWDATSPYPITSLPIVEQLIFATSICAGTVLSITIPYTAVSIGCVLCGSSPGSWPPMFDSPFNATSLRDFWSNRWHWIFRRVFGRLSIPLVSLSRSVIGHNSTDAYKGRIAAITRPAITFALSTLLHLIIMYRLALGEYRKHGLTDRPSFWEPAVLKFFMCQPLGLFLESVVIISFANRIFPAEEQSRDRRQASQIQSSTVRTSLLKSWGDAETCDAVVVSPSLYRWERVVITRLYAWLFLLWTGRWWADKWVRAGYFHEAEKVVPFSVWRGLWHGKWVP